MKKLKPLTAKDKAGLAAQFGPSGEQRGEPPLREEGQAVFRQELPPIKITDEDASATMEWSGVMGDFPRDTVPVSWFACRERQLLIALAENESLKATNAKMLELLREYRNRHDCVLYQGHGGCSVCHNVDLLLAGEEKG